MQLQCKWCCKMIPKEDAKRCARCRLVVYCSKDCQVFSWKASHKNMCQVHPSLLTENGEQRPADWKPEPFTKEWAELELDKGLSKWIAQWHAVFRRYTHIALDQANHPPERVTTHCMYLIIQPHNMQDDSSKDYMIVSASLLPITEVCADNPGLHLNVDYNTLDRHYFVIQLQNYRGEPRRARGIAWTDLSTEHYRMMDKATSRKLAEGWEPALQYAVNVKGVKWAEKTLRTKK